MKWLLRIGLLVVLLVVVAAVAGFILIDNIATAARAATAALERMAARPSPEEAGLRDWWLVVRRGVDRPLSGLHGPRLGLRWGSRQHEWLGSWWPRWRDQG